MLFKKKEEKKPRYPTVKSVWDEAKVKSIATSTAFEIDWPFSLVAITFADKPREESHAPDTRAHPKPPPIGMWMYEVWGADSKGHIGRLHFTFFDQDRAIRLALKQAHAASLASGTSTTSLTILKEAGVGDFSAKDREHGYSYESRFAFCGMTVTEKLQSRRLPKWAVPRSDEDFSLDGAPG